jgi:hypothetical protein
MSFDAAAAAQCVVARRLRTRLFKDSGAICRHAGKAKRLTSISSRQESEMKTSCALALASAIILTLGAIPANAAALNRTWVSGTTGSDSNACTITAPCATFQGALSKTAVGGEIDCLTPGDFGGTAGPSGYLLITQSVSIVCDGVSNGGILATGQNVAVSIVGGSGTVVYLSGLDLNGLGQELNFGLNGVYVTAGSTVYIVHSTIRNFHGPGVLVESNTNPTRVFIKDSIIANNGGGVSVQATDGATNAVIMVNTVLDGNGAVGASATDSDSYLSFANSFVTGSSTGIQLESGASAELVGPSNAIAGAVTGTTTSVPFK